MVIPSLFPFLSVSKFMYAISIVIPLLAFPLLLQPATNQMQLVTSASQDYKKPWLAGFWELKLSVAGGRTCSALEQW